MANGAFEQKLQQSTELDDLSLCLAALRPSEPLDTGLTFGCRRLLADLLLILVHRPILSVFRWSTAWNSPAPLPTPVQRVSPI